ncbi:MAG: hypothetical protein C0616_08785 [Desulfuromonas sp.]|nr:MAG: hypothetical protein C0616_08785 [Desulfuromonas sp.]
MQKFIWSEKYEMGITHLDSQHQYMFGLANEIVRLVNKGANTRELTEVIESLVEYVQLHFDAEERAMEKCGYPGLDEHRQQHVDLTQKLFRLGLGQPSTSQALELTKLVIHWMQHHIMDSDMDFGMFIKDRSNTS